MTGTTPTAFVSWAHTPNEDLDADHWFRQVFNFTNALRAGGIDADLDLFHLQDLGINWAHYGPRKIQTSDFTVVVVNRAWKQRFQGDNLPTQGAGAAAEANVLHGLFAADQDALMKRLVLVLLPDGKTADIPAGLHGFQRVHLEDLTPAGMAKLLALLWQVPRWPKAPLGARPSLEPFPVFEVPTASEVERIMTNPVDPHVPSTKPARAEVVGVPEEGWSDVSRALAVNPHGDLVRELLSTVAGWPDVVIRGKKNIAKQVIEYDKYLSLAVPGHPIFGYVWPKTGVVNPRASFVSAAELTAVADRAVFLPRATNPKHVVRFDLTDRITLEQALTMLEHALPKS